MKGITQKEFEKRIEERYSNEKFEIIEYMTSSKPCKIKCLSCGKILEYPQAKNFLAKHKIAGCSNCQGLRAKNKQNIDLVKEKYDILNVERQNSKLLYTCRCKICGRISTHALDSFINNHCRCESPGNHYTEQEFKMRLQEEYGDEYLLLSPFTGVNHKTLFKHICGFAWSTTPAHLLYNHCGCPKCSYKSSKGVKIIEKALSILQIPYEREKFLENSLQRFDFYLEYNNQVYAIEYNGKQHYEYVPFLHGNDVHNFEKTQERDMRKAKYCFEHNIQLIVIPYTLSNSQIKEYINNLFSSSTTSSLNVDSSESK